MDEINESDMRGFVDMSENAKQANIAMPVVLSESLIKTLRPNKFLSELGITYERRLENLFELVRARLKPNVKSEMSGDVFAVPLIVVNGPLVREDVITAVVRMQTDSKNEKTIIITNLQEPDNEDEE